MHTTFKHSQHPDHDDKWRLNIDLAHIGMDVSRGYASFRGKLLRASSRATGVQTAAWKRKRRLGQHDVETSYTQRLLDL